VRNEARAEAEENPRNAISTVAVLSAMLENISPYLLINMDETTIVANNDQTETLVYAFHTDRHVSRTVQQHHEPVLRVKMLAGESAAGVLLPPVFVVTRTQESSDTTASSSSSSGNAADLNTDSCYVIRVPMLSATGTAESEGYFWFAPSRAGSASQMKKYVRDILLPFVDRVRLRLPSRYSPDNPRAAEPEPAVLLLDGGPGHITATADEEVIGSTATSPSCRRTAAPFFSRLTSTLASICSNTKSTTQTRSHQTRTWSSTLNCSRLLVTTLCPQVHAR
jgi:hypothetical protein